MKAMQWQMHSLGGWHTADALSHTRTHNRQHYRHHHRMHACLAQPDPMNARTLDVSLCEDENG